MTYSKKHKSYKKGRSTSRRRSSFDGSLLRALPTFILLLSGVVFVGMNLDLESFFTQNKTKSNEHIVEEIDEVIEIEEAEIIETEEENAEVNDEIYTIVEEMPRFPGCEDLDISVDEKKNCAEKKMLEFIYKNIKYPQAARNYSGDLIVVSFIIDKEGNVIESKILRGEVESMNEEALNLVNSMPRWIPGKRRGKPVNVQFNLPIRIKLES